jgi:DinB superfamily
VDRWAGDLYGDPCRECSFAFSATLDDSLAYLSGVSEEYAALLDTATGTERHPELSWTVGAYVCHVADNLHIWAERLAGAAAGVEVVAPYDQDELAAARSYAEVPLAAALWSLGRGLGDWQAAVTRVPATGVVISHPERGGMDLGDVARAVAHDTHHHAWDIRRSLEAPR